MRDTDPVLSLEVGRRLRAARLRAGYSQQRLADEILVPRTSVTRLESGEWCISLAQLYRYAKALGVRPHDLLPEP